VLAAVALRIPIKCCERLAGVPGGQLG
jgi:hypothetical protein